MSDITAVLKKTLEQRGARLRSSPRAEVSEEFLREAYTILGHVQSLHRYLLSQRQAYLTTTAPRADSNRKHLTDAQRDQIDRESKQMLLELNGAIRKLSDSEALRRSVEEARQQKKYGLGALSRWAAGGLTVKSAKQLEDEVRTQDVKIHRESIIWFLRRKLEAAGDLQRSMVETRLTREMEKSRSVLYKAGVVQPITATPSTAAVLLDEDEKKAIEQQLSPEQLQLFAKENQDMLKHYEDALDQVRTAERSLIEISELQTTLAENLALQTAQIDQMVADSQSTSENVSGGNRELKKATERRSTAKMVFYSSLAFSGFLIVYDLLI